MYVVPERTTGRARESEKQGATEPEKNEKRKAQRRNETESHREVECETVREREKLKYTLIPLVNNKFHFS